MKNTTGDKKKTDDHTDTENEVHRKLSYFEASIDLIKCIMGAGILAVPYGFFRSGWLSAFLMASFIIFITVYCQRILINCMQQIRVLNKLDDISYPDAVYEGFKDGPPCLQKMQAVAPICVKWLVVLYHFNCGPVYILIISNSVREVVSYYQGTTIDVRLYMLALAPLIIIIYLVNNLKALTPFTVIATSLILTGLSLTLYFVLRTALPPISSRKMFNHIEYLPEYVGLILLTSASPGVVLAIERAMKDRQLFISYYGVLNVSMTLIYILVMSFSLVGYWRYGDDTKDNILLNIPKEEVLAQVTKILYAVAVYFSYPLQLFPVIQSVWTEGLALKCKPNRRFWYEMLLRIFIVLLTTLIAIAIPFFHIVVSLNGCIAITILVMAIPALLDISIRHPDNYGPIRLALVRDILLIIIGIFFCIAGLIVSGFEMYYEFTNTNSTSTY